MNSHAGSGSDIPQLKLLTVGVLSVALIALILPTIPAIALIATTMLASVIYLNEHTDWSIAHPFAFLSLSLLISVVGPLYDFLVLDAHEATWALLGWGRDILVPGGFVALVGVAGLVYGYASSWGYQIGHRITHPDRIWNRHRALQVAKAYAVVGVVALTFAVVPLELGDISAKRSFSTVYVRWMVQFLFFAGLVAFVTVLHFNESMMSPLGLACFTLVGLYFTYGFIVSSRSTILWNSFLLLAIYVHYRRIRAGPLVGLGGAFMVISSIVLALRSEREPVFAYLSPFPIVESVFGADRGSITALSHLVRLTSGGSPFRYGETMIQWVVFPIPRTFWPGKPELVGNQLATIIYGATNGTPPSLIGDLYWNFWLVGVLAGMFIVGLFLRILVQYRNEADRAPGAVLLTTVAILLTSRLPSTTTFVVKFGLWMAPLTVAVIVARTKPSEDPTEALHRAPPLVSSSRVVYAGAVMLSLLWDLKAAVRHSRARALLQAGWPRICQAVESSRTMAMLRRLDQYPRE